MMEKDKLHAKKQALQKKEKDGRLAELKMFHQTFKLNVPIPADLVPLLSLKGKKTTEATTAATTAAAVPEKKKSVTTSPVVTKSPAPSPTPAPINTAPAPTPALAPLPPPHSDPATSPTNSSSFKFNVKASSFKPNPTAAAFVPGGVDKPTKKKHDPSQHLTMTEAFVPSFVEKDIHPSSVGPTWPFGTKSYRVQFNQYAYEEDVFTGYPSPNYAYGYPQYRYPQYVQGMPPMAVQQGPYMNPQVSFYYYYYFLFLFF